MPLGPVSMSKMSNWNIMFSSLRAGRTYSSIVGTMSGERDFANGHHVVIFVENFRPYFVEVFVNVGAVAVMHPSGTIAWEGNWRVWELWVFRDHVDDIHSEAADAFLEPEVHITEDRRAELWILPVQIRLLDGEDIE